MQSSIDAFHPGEVLQQRVGEPVHVQWLGTAGFRITHAGFVLLVDPFLSRPALATCITRPLVSDPRIVDRHVDRADAILLSHTHFDHALDVPRLARTTGAVVYGSWSAARLCHASGVPDRQVRVVEQNPQQPPSRIAVGPFEVRFLPGEHSHLAAGRIPFLGEIRHPALPMRVWEYRCGAVFVIELRVAGRLLVHLGSASLEHGRLSEAADLMLACVSGWRSSPDLPERLVNCYAPRNVLLSHWDDFFRGLDEPVRALPGVGMQEFAGRMGSRRAGTLQPLQSVQV